MNYLILALLFFINSACTTVHPTKLEQYSRTSVIITNPDETGGGTGVIYRSGNNHSYVLTNRHVCSLLSFGGTVVHETDRYIIAAWKASKVHDMCLVWVNGYLGVETTISKTPPIKYDPVFISGHPSLLPHVLSTGYFAADMEIDIMTSQRECTEAEYRNNPFQCIFGGGMPVIEKLASQLTTALISPGSSGSGVFNANGEIIGLAFAGNGRGIGYSLIVPWNYLNDFVYSESVDMAWTYPVKDKKAETKPTSINKPQTMPLVNPKEFDFDNTDKWNKFLKCLQDKKCSK